MTMHSINLIGVDPQVRNGQPCIAGTGVRVADVAIATIFHARLPDEIASDYQVSLAQVYAALAYYYEHKTAIDEAIREQIARARDYRERRVGATRPSLLSR